MQLQVLEYQVTQGGQIGLQTMEVVEYLLKNLQYEMEGLVIRLKHLLQWDLISELESSPLLIMPKTMMQEMGQIFGWMEP